MMSRSWATTISTADSLLTRSSSASRVAFTATVLMSMVFLCGCVSMYEYIVSPSREVVNRHGQLFDTSVVVGTPGLLGRHREWKRRRAAQVDEVPPAGAAHGLYRKGLPKGHRGVVHEEHGEHDGSRD